MRDVTIHTLKRSTVLDHNLALVLLQRVRHSGGPDRSTAADPLDQALAPDGTSDVRLSPEEKQAILNAIRRWNDAPKTIRHLQYELMRDLNVPPFDQPF